jgi:hypothetical protein
VRYKFFPFISLNTPRNCCRKPTSCADTSCSFAAAGAPADQPVPSGLSIQSTLDRFVQLYGFCVGAACPNCHEIGPFSCRRPSSEEQPGPPLSQLRARISE